MKIDFEKIEHNTGRKFDDFLEEQLRDPEFREEYEALQPEHAIIQALINASIPFTSNSRDPLRLRSCFNTQRSTECLIWKVGRCISRMKPEEWLKLPILPTLGLFPKDKAA